MSGINIAALFKQKHVSRWSRVVVQWLPYISRFPKYVLSFFGADYIYIYISLYIHIHVAENLSWVHWDRGVAQCKVAACREAPSCQWFNGIQSVLDWWWLSGLNGDFLVRPGSHDLCGVTAIKLRLEPVPICLPVRIAIPTSYWVNISPRGWHANQCCFLLLTDLRDRCATWICRNSWQMMSRT